MSTGMEQLLYKERQQRFRTLQEEQREAVGLGRLTVSWR